MRTRAGITLLATAAVSLAAAIAAAAAAAAPPSVQLMVVGKTRMLKAPGAVTAKRTTVTIGRRRCTVIAGTALAALIDARLRPRVGNVAGCDPASMFVTTIGPDANRGFAGWQYKIGHASPSYSAGEAAGRLRRGQHLLWFWCTRANACQHTLDFTLSTNRLTGVARVTVTGYDDNGHGTRVPGATVHLDTGPTVTTGRDGTASIVLTPGRHTLYASKAGLIQSFPQTIAR